MISMYVKKKYAEIVVEAMKKDVNKLVQENHFMTARDLLYDLNSLMNDLMEEEEKEDEE